MMKSPVQLTFASSATKADSPSKPPSISTWTPTQWSRGLPSTRNSNGGEYFLPRTERYRPPTPTKYSIKPALYARSTYCISLCPTVGEIRRNGIELGKEVDGAEKGSRA